MKNKKNKKDNNIWKTVGGNIIIWILIIVMSITALQYFSSDYKPITIAYTEFLEHLNNGNIESGKIIGRKFNGRFKNKRG